MKVIMIGEKDLDALVETVLLRIDSKSKGGGKGDRERTVEYAAVHFHVHTMLAAIKESKL